MTKKKQKKMSYILDTSVLLEDAHNLFLLSDNGTNEIIIPETVLDEMDHKKIGFSDINYQAREFNRILDKFTISKVESVKDMMKTTLEFEGVKITTYSKEKYQTEYVKDNGSIYNDRKILEICRNFPKSILISNDIALRIRASSVGLTSEPLKRDRIENVEAISFIETITIPENMKSQIEEVYFPELIDSNLTNFTNVVFQIENKEEQILAFYKSNRFHIINEKKLRKLVVNPRNKEQLFFLNMLLDPDIQIIVCAGVTGSGKNLLSLQGALECQRKNPEDLSIKYCRNTITAGDQNAQLGFLKGDENQKLSVFMYPLNDAVESYIALEKERALKYNKKIPVITEQEFMETHAISTVNINQMRGVNLNGFIILDEWQNSSSSVNKLMLTRIAEGSKVVIIGDINQIDNPYLNKYNNALSIMLKQAKTSNIVGGITMSRVLRGTIADYADKNL